MNAILGSGCGAAGTGGGTHGVLPPVAGITGPLRRPEPPRMRVVIRLMWYKNAVIYNLDVETFMDSNGDGIGDFRGLIERIDHFESLGVTCVWLQPFFPSPNRDDGYDISDYYAVDSRLGTLGDFAEFSHQLHERGIRLILDLVVNHSSDQHPWFKEACRDPDSPYRDYYIWSAEKPADAHEGMVFPGVQHTTWTRSREAGAWYHHRFFEHQPDLNIANPAVREEILRIMGFWQMLGVSGFRVDAAPFLIETDKTDKEQDTALYEFLRDMNHFLAWRTGSGILLAEANVAPELVDDYFGNGDRMQMLFSFLHNQPMFLAFARGEAEPLVWALRSAPKPPYRGQWAQFLRGHDELDLGQLGETERQEVFAAFGPKPNMQIYGRGIRRRLAPMFGNDRRRVEMAHSLMCSLPGSQVIRYGDEIGMGDDLSLKERESVRTPMQWSDSRNGGFSKAPAKALIRPVIGKGDYGFAKVNVQAQLGDSDSLFNRMARLIRVRHSCPEIGEGEATVIATDRPEVFAIRCDRDGRGVLALHNLADRACTARLLAGGLEGHRLVDLASDQAYPAPEDGFDLGPYGYRWLRIVGA